MIEPAGASAARTPMAYAPANASIDMYNFLIPLLVRSIPYLYLVS
jgi:hypothetical protein